MARRFIVGLAVLSLGVATPVFAQDEDEALAQDEGLGEGAEGSDSDGWGEDDASNDASQDAAQDAAGDEESAADDAPREWYFGPFFRWMFVPEFMLSLFLDEAPTVGNPSFGATATHRGDDLNVVLGLGYTSYAFEDAFRISGDPEEDTEWLDSSLGLVHVTASLLWETDLSDKVSIEYGFGMDLGIVTGELVRNEAYPSGDGYAPCVAPGVPPAPLGYCEAPDTFPTDAYDEDGAHYGVVEERVPPVAPVPILPHLAVSYRPTPEWQIKGEFGTALFFTLWLGVSVGYAPAL